MSAFDKLLGELSSAQTEQETLAKSLTATNEGAGGEGGEGGGEGAGATGGEGGGEGAGAGATGGEGGESLMKSFKVVGANGEEIEAFDGSEMLKSLEARLTAGEKQTTEVVTGLVNLVKGQNALIKSMSEQLQALGNQGRGRRTVLSVTEQKPLAKGGNAEHASGNGDGEPVQEFLAKSEAAWKAGAITGREFTTIDVACRSGVALDQDLIKKVQAHK